LIKVIYRQNRGLKMELSLNEVRSIAKLCRIRLTEKEIKSLQDDLKNIFEYFSDLETLDTSSVEPTGWNVQNQNVLREDIAYDSLPATKILSNSPNTDNNFIKVRRVLN